MSQSQEIRWVVLLHKSPKGPLRSEEVEALLEEGLLRRNDLAFQIGVDGRTKLSDWKFLWQFPEFNRRGAMTPPSVLPAVIPVEEEHAAERRNNARPTEEERAAAIAALPPELADLDPADLAMTHSASSYRSDFGSSPSEALPLERLSSLGGRRQGVVWFLVLGGVTVGLVVALVSLLGSTASKSGTTTASATKLRPPSAARPFGNNIGGAAFRNEMGSLPSARPEGPSYPARDVAVEQPQPFNTIPPVLRGPTPSEDEPLEDGEEDDVIPEEAMVRTTRMPFRPPQLNFPGRVRANTNNPDAPEEEAESPFDEPEPPAE